MPLTTSRRCPVLNAPLRSALSFFYPSPLKGGGIEKEELHPWSRQKFLSPHPLCLGEGSLRAGRAGPKALRAVPACWHQGLETEPLRITATKQCVLRISNMEISPAPAAALLLFYPRVPKTTKMEITMKRSLVQYADA